tara:strand:- start:17 stop:2338 length:2322 start_codon:yes stop_codon:yes gene_type:complete
MFFLCCKPEVNQIVGANLSKDDKPSKDNKYGSNASLATTSTDLGSSTHSVLENTETVVDKKNEIELTQDKTSWWSLVLQNLCCLKNGKVNIVSSSEAGKCADQLKRLTGPKTFSIEGNIKSQLIEFKSQGYKHNEDLIFEEGSYKDVKIKPIGSLAKQEENHTQIFVGDFEGDIVPVIAAFREAGLDIKGLKYAQIEIPKEDGTEQSNEIEQISNVEYLPYKYTQIEMPKEDGTEQSNEIKQTSNIEYLPYIEFEKMATVTEKDIDVNFLGDIPDRGYFSEIVINTLLQNAKKFKEDHKININIFLGNHDAMRVLMPKLFTYLPHFMGIGPLNCTNFDDQDYYKLQKQLYKQLMDKEIMGKNRLKVFKFDNKNKFSISHSIVTESALKDNNEKGFIYILKDFLRANLTHIEKSLEEGVVDWRTNLKEKIKELENNSHTLEGDNLDNWRTNLELILNGCLYDIKSWHDTFDKERTGFFEKHQDKLKQYNSFNEDNEMFNHFNKVRKKVKIENVNLDQLKISVGSYKKDSDIENWWNNYELALNILKAEIEEDTTIWTPPKGFFIVDLPSKKEKRENVTFYSGHILSHEEGPLWLKLCETKSKKINFSSEEDRKESFYISTYYRNKNNNFNIVNFNGDIVVGHSHLSINSLKNFEETLVWKTDEPLFISNTINILDVDCASSSAMTMNCRKSHSRIVVYDGNDIGQLKDVSYNGKLGISIDELWPELPLKPIISWTRPKQFKETQDCKKVIGQLAKIISIFTENDVQANTKGVKK